MYDNSWLGNNELRLLQLRLVHMPSTAKHIPAFSLDVYAGKADCPMTSRSEGTP